MISTNDEARGDNILAISRLGFSAEYWYRFFGHDAEFQKGRIKLPTTHRFLYSDSQAEILYYDGKRLIPSQSYFEYNFSDIVSQGKKVYIFQSSTDALAYVQIKSMIETDATFFALGKNPNEDLVRHLKERFHYAKFILCFPRGLMSTLSEIKTAAFLANERLSLELINGALLCGYRNKKEEVPLDILSLSKISKQVGFYPKNIRTIKPPKDHNSFFDFLRSLR